MRFKLSKIFSLSNREHERSRFIKLDSLDGRTHEINFHIDTQDLNLFKDDSKNLKLHLKPLEISLNLTISSCMKNLNIYQPQQQKSILKQILVNFNLGYVRLKTNAIDFMIMKKIYKNHVEYEMEESQTKNLVSISNAGNVPIKLKCYLLDKNINDNLKTHSIRVNSEFISFDEFSTHKNLDVVLEKKLAHESTLNCNQENLNTALIVEVLPNGIKYEIPIKIEIKEIVQPASPIQAQTNLNHIFSQYDSNNVTSSGGSYRRSTLNYENDFIFQHQKKSKNVEVEEIELKEENEETTIINAYSNDTYGIYLSPKKNDINDHVELNKFIEENQQRVERIRYKRIQKNTKE